MTPSDFPYELTEHAAKVITERGIHLEWVAAVLRHPAATAPDADDPQVRHAMAPIEEYGRRVLRVVYNEQVEPWRIVTAFFDRALKGRL